MTHLTSTSVHNGERLPVEWDFFNGLAGVRGDDQGGEFACVPDEPVFGFMGGSGKVGNRPVRITSVRKSMQTPSMVVARFTYTDEGGPA